MRKTYFQIGLGLTAILMISVFSIQTYSHCQIPCGIYGDDTRFTMLEEHIKTIEKSMNEINKLSVDSPESNVNQLVRWVQNKENHADAFTEIVTQYFLSQRIKPAGPSDQSGVRRLHQQAGSATQHDGKRHEGQTNHRPSVR